MIARIGKAVGWASPILAVATGALLLPPTAVGADGAKMATSVRVEPGLAVLPRVASPERPCGTARRAPGRWRHVIWVIIENHGFESVTDPVQAPYLSSLAAQCGLATNVRAITHPSLPNYIAVVAGSTLGVTTGASPPAYPLSGPNIFSQLGPQSWRLYAESMPSPCYRSNSGQYVVRHNPAAYFVDLAASCAERDLPLPAEPNLSARLTVIVPNQINNMHDSTVATGDAYLSTLVPSLLASRQYRQGKTAIMIFADEDEGTAANRTAAFVIAPSVRRGVATARRFSLYSVLKTTEQMLGLRMLRGARSARSMRAAFNLAR